MKRDIKTFVFFISIMLAVVGGAINKVNETFIQLDDKLISYTHDEWKKMFQLMKKSGLDVVYLQWSAEFICSLEIPYGSNMMYGATLENIFKAANDENMNLIVGLTYDHQWWQHITASPEKLKHYLSLRKMNNFELYKELLQQFGSYSNWHGVYIPDEIDDLSWRDQGKRMLFAKYLKELSNGLKKINSNKPIHISAFFRARSEPSIFASNLYELLSDTDITSLLLQNGQGNNNPPIETLKIYLTEIQSVFIKKSSINLKLVLEIFQEQPTTNKVFNAVPQTTNAITKQIDLAIEQKMQASLFAFYPYLINDLNNENELFKWFITHNKQ